MEEYDKVQTYNIKLGALRNNMINNELIRMVERITVVCLVSERSVVGKFEIMQILVKNDKDSVFQYISNAKVPVNGFNCQPLA